MIEGEGDLTDPEVGDVAVGGLRPVQHQGLLRIMDDGEEGKSQGMMAVAEVTIEHPDMLHS